MNEPRQAKHSLPGPDVPHFTSLGLAVNISVSQTMNRSAFLFSAKPGVLIFCL